ncbi:MAG: hypothetical protein IPH88_00075 [Bacteroidales bacterium]|nr:hypothetical protein [Bacteroidales bacterium]
MKTRIFITFLLLTALGFFSSCEKKEDNPDNGNTDSTGGFNAVLFPGNGWKSIARIHAKNTAATGYQWYDVTACGLSIDYSDVLHFILVDAKQSQQDVWNTWYEGTVNLSSGDKLLTKLDSYQKDRFYFYKPGTPELYSSGTNEFQGPYQSYTNSHPSAVSYTGTPTVDKAGNIMTYRTLTGVGTEDFIFYRKAGSSVDSMFTDGSQSIILSGFYPALMNNGRIYNLVKLDRTVYLQRAEAGDYQHNQRGYLKTIASIECPDFLDNISTSYLARVSPDRRFIYYWVIESYSSPVKGWFFKFDVNTETLTKVYDNIDIIAGFVADGTGASRTSAIADDGTLYIGGFEDPNASRPKAKIFRVPADGTAVTAELYKSSNLLQADSYGNQYRINTLQYLNGKVYFTVQSGLMPYENPQIDIITEE